MTRTDRLVSLEDDVGGFDESAGRASQGLRNTWHRAAVIGGMLSLRSRAAVGPRSNSPCGL
jgi:hypothetical protein